MNRIRSLRDEYDIDQKVLAIDLGVSQPTISDWENGKKQPSSKSAAKLADYFNVSIDYLLGRDDNPHPTSSPKGIKIPVLGRVAAGIPIEAIEEILDYEEIDEAMAKTGDFFALRIAGTSMEPRMKEGDVVIVRKQDSVENGEIAVVLVNGDDATCKKVSIHENGLSLVSINPSYAPMFFTDKEVLTLPVQILGRVVELRAKF
ncbi:MAG: LexA family protein [Christensenellales bacterium]